MKFNTTYIKVHKRFLGFCENTFFINLNFVYKGELIKTKIFIPKNFLFYSKKSKAYKIAIQKNWRYDALTRQNKKYIVSGTYLIFYILNNRGNNAEY